MFNTNIWSTFFKPRTMTWRMRPTVLAHPKPCSINLRFAAKWRSPRLRQSYRTPLNAGPKCFVQRAV
ncbi:hypothetical protein SAMN05192544_102626 [Paraburkholderia hospita]|nr:hypothetical protein SAMN05192544_102626 [Paraburkholderia hospita]